MEDILKVAQFCRTHLNLSEIKLTNEYEYPGVPLCVIDAVFSIGANYTSTRNTVERFCQYIQINPKGFAAIPDISEQVSISQFLEINHANGVERMAKDVYKNAQRTSPTNGILKAEAALRFAEAIDSFGVEYFQDMRKILGNKDFEARIKEIPGQRSELSLRYFYMLAGSKNYIKPDRMIMRFINSAIGRTPEVEECHTIITGACEILSKEYTALDPRALDHQIWLYQRTAQAPDTD